jgi:GTP-binding protein EngB required for normal cell division
MKIKSAVFMRGVKGDNDILEDGMPQIAFIGRSNVGKYSLLNYLMDKNEGVLSEIQPELIEDYRTLKSHIHE